MPHKDMPKQANVQERNRIIKIVQSLQDKQREDFDLIGPEVELPVIADICAKVWKLEVEKVAFVQEKYTGQPEQDGHIS